ncbi:MAG: hypothetical protein NTW95_13300 [Candidatus Aminicenantes bacterium]|nr:hypothetical protein [Candidatus Aminicenantes bacterium]
MNITYLFGAGASAYAIPTIENIPEHLEEFYLYLDNIEDSPPGPNVSPQHYEYRPEKPSSQLKKDIKWLIDNLKYATSIDTLAKRLFIKNSKDYFKIKALMIIFFVFEHFRNLGDKDNDPTLKYKPQNTAIRKIDPRYDNFFAFLIQKEIDDLPNIKILSWNYDMQFEMAFDEYSGLGNFIKNQIYLQIFPSHEVRGFDKSHFGIVKLNGSLQIQRKDDNILPLLYLDKSLQMYSLVRNLINDYVSLIERDRPNPYLFFSWENKDINIQTKKIAYEIASETDVLIVIGYSFPYFNRAWDREIFGGMRQLQKVYFQAPSNDLDNYFSRFKAINSLIPYHEDISDLGQFFIPPELG